MNQDSDLVHWAITGAGGVIGYFLINLHRRVERHIDEMNEAGGPQALMNLRKEFETHEAVERAALEVIRDEQAKIRESIARLEPEVGRLKKIEDSIGLLNNTMLTFSSTLGNLSANVAMLLSSGRER